VYSTTRYDEVMKFCISAANLTAKEKKITTSVRFYMLKANMDGSFVCLKAMHMPDAVSETKSTTRSRRRPTHRYAQI